MNEIQIKKHSFDLAKNRIKDFSNKTEKDIKIDKVNTTDRKWFFFTKDHNVTGYELNTRLETIQNHFLSINKTNNMVIKEFKEIYNALDSLDKDYITSIVANVKAIEKTSNDVRTQQEVLKKHNDKLSEQQDKLDIHQKEIKKNVENISKIVNVLNIFKEKLETYEHLNEIDDVWVDCKVLRAEIDLMYENNTKLLKDVSNKTETLRIENKNIFEKINDEIINNKAEIKTFKNFISGLSDKLDLTIASLNEQIHILEEMVGFRESLKAEEHLYHIDNMWDDIKVCKSNIEFIDKHIEVHNNEINKLTDIMEISNNENRSIVKKLDSKILNNQTEIDLIKNNGANLLNKLNCIDELLNNQIPIIEGTLKFTEHLKRKNHLEDVDYMWNDIEVCKSDIKNSEKHIEIHKSEIEKINVSVYNNKSSIEALLKDLSETNDYSLENRKLIILLEDYINQLNKIEHLKDTDETWNNVIEHSLKIEECEKKDASIIVDMQQNKEEFVKKIDHLTQVQDTSFEVLTKKIKYAYWFAGGATGLALLELVLLLMKVM